jgi:vanillate O-demethylase monooxygenase subunit
METEHANQLTYPGRQGYPRNQWYVAAFSSEVGNGTLLHRRLLDVPVVLYRTPAGEAAALYDRCPHRGLPLSMGKQVEDRIQCGYHGMEFGPDGRCTHIPSQPGAKGTMSVIRFQLVEKWQWLWIWMGDQALADPELIPDHDWLGLTRPGYTAVPFFMMEMGGNYSYIHDNLLDTSHLTYLHPGVLDGGEMANARYWTKEKGQIVSLGREIPGLKFPGPVAHFFRVEEGRTYDRILVTETFVPSISIAKQSLQDAADPKAAPVEFYALNALTPASASSTYVFHAVANSYDPNWQPADFDKGRLILGQDKVAVEAMQRRFDEIGDADERSIKSDHAGVVCRRMITAMIERERSKIEPERRKQADAAAGEAATA